MPPRLLTPERMDDPALDPAAHRDALRGLARIDRVSGGSRLFWPPIRQLAAEAAGRPLRVLDVATGGGDGPVRLWHMAKRAGVPLEVAGCDLSPTAVAHAEERAVAGKAGVRFFVHDALREPLPPGFDVVTCSLFLHHLSEADAVTLLAALGRAAGRLVLVNDLARGRFNTLLVGLACRLLTRSPVVRFDAPASARAAFTPAEARALAETAGLHGATVRRCFPCRFLLAWRKP